MAPRFVLLPVQVEQICVDEGLWCHGCLLCTGIRVWFAVTIGDRTTLRASSICTECGGHEIED